MACMPAYIYMHGDSKANSTHVGVLGSYIGASRPGWMLYVPVHAKAAVAYGGACVHACRSTADISTKQPSRLWRRLASTHACPIIITTTTIPVH